MRIGNVSQTRVGIPDFFYTNNIKEIDAFKSGKDRYFKEGKLFQQMKSFKKPNSDFDHKKLDEYNRIKYKPSHRLPELKFTILKRAEDENEEEEENIIEKMKKTKAEFDNKVPYTNDKLKKN